MRIEIPESEEGQRLRLCEVGDVVRTGMFAGMVVSKPEVGGSMKVVDLSNGLISSFGRETFVILYPNAKVVLEK